MKNRRKKEAERKIPDSTKKNPSFTCRKLTFHLTKSRSSRLVDRLTRVDVMRSVEAVANETNISTMEGSKVGGEARKNTPSRGRKEAEGSVGATQFVGSVE